MPVTMAKYQCRWPRSCQLAIGITHQVNKGLVLRAKMLGRNSFGWA